MDKYDMFTILGMFLVGALSLIPLFILFGLIDICINIGRMTT